MTSIETMGLGAGSYPEPYIENEEGLCCDECGEELEAYEAIEYKGRLLCSRCYSEKEEAYADHLEEFLNSRKFDFLKWAFSGDCIDIGGNLGYRFAGWEYGYGLFKKDYPELAKAMEKDFTGTIPGEWPDFIKGEIA